jgi:hypothetical protein
MFTMFTLVGAFGELREARHQIVGPHLENHYEG